jgi:two-component system nitrogen regulation response regulator GlnG
MASGQEILLEDLPSELTEKTNPSSTQTSSWQAALSDWMDYQLAQGNNAILDVAMPEFEKIMLERALLFTQGHKQDAAKKLGWGRNTLTRKLKELDIN